MPSTADSSFATEVAASAGAVEPFNCAKLAATLVSSEARARRFSISLRLSAMLCFASAVYWAAGERMALTL